MRSNEEPANAAQSTNQVLDRRRLLGGLFLLISLLLCGAVLLRMPGQIVDRLYLPRWAAIAPFGRFEVVFVHLVAGLAIALTLANLVRPWFGSENRNAVTFAAIIGGVVAVLTLYLAPVSRQSVNPFWIRILWTLALQLPWCLAASLVLPTPRNTLAGWPLGVVATAAILLPMAHGRFAARRESKEVAYYISTQQYMKAWSHIVALESMAGVQTGVGAGGPVRFFSTRAEGGRPSNLIRSDLAAGIAAQIAEANQPVPPNANLDVIVRRGSTLLSLDRLDEAASLLEGAKIRRPDALLVLAAIYEEQRNPAKVVETLEEAIGLIGDAKGEIVEDTTRRIYQRLAQNLRLQQRYGDAEARLLDAVARFDHSHGFFFFELGLHCQQGGRFRKALEYYQQCVTADKDYLPRVERAERQLRLNTPACVLKPVANVSR